MTRVTVTTAGLLSLIAGRVMVRDLSEIGDAATAVIGYPVYTHELGPVIETAKQVIPAQLPGFPTEAADDNWKEVLADTVARFGDTVEIERGTLTRGPSPMETMRRAKAEAEARP